MQFPRPTKVPPAQRPGAALDVLTGAGWRRRVRLSLEAERLRELRLHPHDLSLFPDRVHFIRVDGRLVAWPTPRWEWVRAGQGAGPQRLAPLGRLESLQIPAFELSPRFHKPTPSNVDFAHLGLGQAAAGPRAGVSPGSAGSAGGASGSSAGASGAVGAGAAVLALAALVLLARALERCLDQRFFKLLRRRTDEWCTPNVLATSTHLSEDSVEGAGPDCPSVPSGDPPPPYSMCVPKSASVPRPEAPPPYSACYVAFGPHDQPRVRLNGPTLNSFRDTGQNGTDGASRATHDIASTIATESRAGEEADSGRDRANVASEGSNAPPYSQVA